MTGRQKCKTREKEKRPLDREGEKWRGREGGRVGGGYLASEDEKKKK